MNLVWKESPQSADLEKTNNGEFLKWKILKRALKIEEQLGFLRGFRVYGFSLINHVKSNFSIGYRFPVS